MSDPFFFPGDSSGCLLIHGFSGSPSEMRGLGEHLAAAGHTVLGVCLAGHGRTPEALQATRWRDWLASAEAGFDELRGRCTRVAIVGFSLGGALGLLMARRRPCDRLVLLSTPLWLAGDWRVNALGLLRYVVPWFYPLAQADFSDPFVQLRVREHAPDIDLGDPAVQQQIRRSVKISVAAIDELRQVLAQARRAVPHVRVPALVMHGRTDDISPPASAAELMNRLGSPERDLVWWDDTGHQLLLVGPHRQAIYERIAAFV